MRSRLPAPDLAITCQEHYSTNGASEWRNVLGEGSRARLGLGYQHSLARARTAMFSLEREAEVHQANGLLSQCGPRLTLLSQGQSQHAAPRRELTTATKVPIKKSLRNRTADESLFLLCDLGGKPWKPAQGHP